MHKAPGLRTSGMSSKPVASPVVAWTNSVGSFNASLCQDFTLTFSIIETFSNILQVWHQINSSYRYLFIASITSQKTVMQALSIIN